MATAKGKRPAAKRRVLLAQCLEDAQRDYVKNSKASHLMATFNATDKGLRESFLRILGRSRYRRACTGERVPKKAIEAIRVLTNGRIDDRLWRIPAQGPPPYPYHPRFEP